VSPGDVDAVALATEELVRVAIDGTLLDEIEATAVLDSPGLGELAADEIP
jgi:hypothetical protein